MTVCTKSVSVVKEMIVEAISEVNRFVLVALLDKVKVCVTEDVVYPRKAVQKASRCCEVIKSYASTTW